MSRRACKPNLVFQMTISLGQILLSGSCALPNLRLHQAGFAQIPVHTGKRVSSYLTISPLPRPKRRGGILSVVLSLEFAEVTKVSRTSSCLNSSGWRYQLPLALLAQGVFGLSSPTECRSGHPACWDRGSIPCFRRQVKALSIGYFLC